MITKKYVWNIKNDSNNWKIHFWSKNLYNYTKKKEQNSVPSQQTQQLYPKALCSIVGQPSATRHVAVISNDKGFNFKLNINFKAKTVIGTGNRPTFVINFHIKSSFIQLIFFLAAGCYSYFFFLWKNNIIFVTYFLLLFCSIYFFLLFFSSFYLIVSMIHHWNILSMYSAVVMINSIRMVSSSSVEFCHKLTSPCIWSLLIITVVLLLSQSSSVVTPLSFFFFS